MRIQHNISALNSHRQLGTNNTAIGKNLEKLSSGFKINKAGDDAAGLAISEKMRAQIKGLETAQKNAQDGISLVQTAEGALTEVHSMLNRMAELATQSANGTYDNTTDRANLQKEVESLKSEIDRIADSTNFNGIKLLNGDLGKMAKATATSAEVTGKFAAGAIDFKVESEGNDVIVKFAQKTSGAKSVEASWNDKTLTITLGANGAATFTQKEIDEKIAAADAPKEAKGLKVTLKRDIVAGAATAGGGVAGATPVDIANASATTANAGKPLELQVGDTNDPFQKVSVRVGEMHTEGLGIKEISIADQEKAGAAIEKIKSAINTVSSTRGDLGAIQNRLEHTINNLGVTTENMTAAESRIRDVDMAKEMMEFTKNNILSQAATSMLAQANQTPQGVLQLLN